MRDIGQTGAWWSLQSCWPLDDWPLTTRHYAWPPAWLMVSPHWPLSECREWPPLTTACKWPLTTAGDGGLHELKGALYQTRRSRWCAGNHRCLMRKCQKTEFCGGHLGFWRPFWIDNGYLISSMVTIICTNFGTFITKWTIDTPIVTFIIFS